jgi:DNA-binding transcriptional MerR regulator
MTAKQQPEPPNEPTKPTHTLKIGQLAKRAGVSVSTIKYYLKEGLIPPPVKGDGSLSYYGQEHLERILLIKKMQKEQYLPLSIIKTFLPDETGVESNRSETDEGSAWEVNQLSDLVTLDEIATRSGCTADQIRLLETKHYIQPIKTLKGLRYEAIDCEVAALFKRREALGLPWAYNLEVFNIYRRHLRRAINEDVIYCFRNVIEGQESAEPTTYMTEADKSVAEFIRLFKLKYTRQRVDHIIRRHENIPIHIVEALNFRSLEGIAHECRPETDTEQWLPPLAWVLRIGEAEANGNQAAVEKKSDDDEMAVTHLVNGIFDMIEGKNDAAMTSFNRIDESSRYAAAANALSALVEMMQISRLANMYSFIGSMRKAVNLIRRSAQLPDQGMAGLLAAYFRLVGFAVRPNFFDVEADAHREFDRIKSYPVSTTDEGGFSSVLQVFLQELTLKSTYLLRMVSKKYKGLAFREPRKPGVASWSSKEGFMRFSKRQFFGANYGESLSNGPVVRPSLQTTAEKRAVVA